MQPATRRLGEREFRIGRQRPVDRVKLKGVLIGGFVISGLSLIIAIMAISGGAIGPRGWIGALARAALTAGFGCFAFMKPQQVTA